MTSKIFKITIPLVILGASITGCQYTKNIRKTERTVHGCEGFTKFIEESWKYDTNKNIYYLSKGYKSHIYFDSNTKHGAYNHCLKELDTTDFFQLFGHPNEINYKYHLLKYYLAESCHDSKEGEYYCWYFKVKFSKDWIYKQFDSGMSIQEGGY